MSLDDLVQRSIKKPWS